MKSGVTCLNLWWRVAVEAEAHLRNPNLGFIVEARKLEHQYPHALKVEYRGS